MNFNFSNCLAVILESEGAYVVDQGGPTNLGVTQRALSAWYGRAATVAEVQALTASSVAPLYQQDYWVPAQCGNLLPGVDLMVFDEAVNEGVGRAVRHLQQVIGVAADGVFGPVTVAALATAQAPQGAAQALIQRLHDENASYYASLAAEFLQDEAGWRARNDRTVAAALKMVQAP